jgi:hypothetical protein
MVHVAARFESQFREGGKFVRAPGYSRKWKRRGIGWFLNPPIPLFESGMRFSVGFLALVLLGSCASTPETLVVKQHLVRDQTRDSDEEPMVRMEKERRLRGAISMEERRQRLGQYYTILWSDPMGKGRGPVEVVFEYRQGASGSRVKRMTRSFPALDVQGTAAFAVAGDDYFKNGRVLAWQAKVFRAGTELAAERSYLWR